MSRSLKRRAQHEDPTHSEVVTIHRVPRVDRVPFHSREHEGQLLPVLRGGVVYPPQQVQQPCGHRDHTDPGTGLGLALQDNASAPPPYDACLN